MNPNHVTSAFKPAAATRPKKRGTRHGPFPPPVRHEEIPFVVHVPHEEGTLEVSAGAASGDRAASDCFVVSQPPVTYDARLFRVQLWDNEQQLYANYSSGCCTAIIERVSGRLKMRVRNCGGFRDETFHRILSVIAASFRFTNGGEPSVVSRLSDNATILRNAMIPFTILRSSTHRCELRDGSEVRCRLETKGVRKNAFISTNKLNPHLNEYRRLMSTRGHFQFAVGNTPPQHILSPHSITQPSPLRLPSFTGSRHFDTKSVTTPFVPHVMMTRSTESHMLLCDSEVAGLRVLVDNARQGATNLLNVHVTWEEVAFFFFIARRSNENNENEDEDEDEKYEEDEEFDHDDQ
ncbi:Hypothetical protein, putative [Bodo saltans]|uniref:Uncharacterized protein n=1 Tax=Bodo saltans TaxID=75058 RepID=A0A0S4JBM8_BODSA|nr:Hypothetical protein, putative [Bodo saltans]|eukprot:CUG86573.1 Hypothetical protein, putative [Bodo saltans]